ncbi:7 transmembrane receptor [Trichuris trichiura]|uniref:7 transmembrane receptor n=1 Tax=Trichuris trichiura TaxID=36087 RepID=A0A077ZBF3_TRITR|nr:7 transmembrane receptor [Trichuris trichiura]
MRRPLSAWIVVLVPLAHSWVQGIIGGSKLPQCSPFRTLTIDPTNAKHRIIAAFPLYEDDCLQVRADSVHTLFAVQWALGIWNRNPQNVNHRIGLSVVGVCFEEHEFVTQSFKLLHSAGYFEQRTCHEPENQTMQYLLLSEISPNYMTYKHFLKSLKLPALTFSTATAQMKSDASLNSLFSTAPTLEDYAEVVTALLIKMNSNWISVIYCKSSVMADALERFRKKLVDSNILVESMTVADIQVPASIGISGRSKIIIILSNRRDLVTLLTWNIGRLRNTLIIGIPTNDQTLSDEQRFQLMQINGQFSLLLLEPMKSKMDDFRDYFVEILRRNSRTYALLASYAHAKFNCTLVNAPGFVDCKNRGDSYLAEAVTTGATVEAAVLATYAVAAMVRMTSTDDKIFACNGQNETADCGEQLTQALKLVRYTFGPDDPMSLRGKEISFDNRLVLENIQIEGRLMGTDSKGRVIDKLVMNYDKSTKALSLNDPLLLPDGRPVRSVCPNGSHSCRTCSLVDMADNQRTWLLYPGDVYLVGMFDLRRWDETLKRCIPSTANDHLSLAATVVYVLETVKQKYSRLNLLPNVRLGALLVDSCGSPIEAADAMLQLRRRCLAFHSQNVTVSFDDVLAFVTGQEDVSYSSTKTFFTENGGFFQPLISVSCQGESCSSREISILPSSQLLSKALLSLLTQFNWSLLSVLVSSQHSASLEAFKMFETSASTQGICIGEVFFIDLPDEKGESQSNVEMTPSNPVVVVFASAADFNRFLKQVNRRKVRDDTVFLLTGQSHDFVRQNSFERSASTNDKFPEEMPDYVARQWTFLSMQPSAPGNDGLARFLSKARPKHLPQPWLVAFWEELLNCAISDDSVERFNKRCEEDSPMAMQTSSELVYERFLMAALEGWVILTDEIYKKVCHELRGLCDEFFQRYPRAMNAWLHLLKSHDRFTLYNIQVNKEGPAVEPVGQWSPEDSLVLHASAEGKIANMNVERLPNSHCQHPLCRCYDVQRNFRLEREKGRRAEIEILMPTQNSEVSSLTPRSGQWRNFGWNYFFLVVNSTLVLITLSVFGIILFKMACHVVKGNQSLGICLLCGVLMLYSTAFLFVFDPTDAICRLRHFGHSFSYSVCFGVLIAKATQLRNSETLGINGYISQWNYWLLLFFIVSVQMALNLQWAIFRNSVVLHFITGDHSDFIVPKCGWTDHEFLTSHSYVVLLLLVAWFISFVNRNVKRNYKETRWLLYTCSLLLPVWITWTAGYLLIPYPYKDALVVIELFSSATIVLALMFGPKLYLLLCYEPVLIEYPTGNVEDNDSSKELYDLEAYFDQTPASASGCSPAGSPLSACRPAFSVSSGDTASNLTDSNSSKYQAVILKKSKSKKVVAATTAAAR